MFMLAAASGAPLHRNYVYARILRDGSAPTWADFTRDLGLSRSETESALNKLAADHDVVLLPTATGGASRSYLLMAHPFSNLPTAHSATHDRDAVYPALLELVASVPALLPRTFLKAPRCTYYGN